MRELFFSSGGRECSPGWTLQKKSAAQEYYDVSDPFIDDSELAVDERTFFAQTKQQGFYVSSGQVALLTDKYVPDSFFGVTALFVLLSWYLYRRSSTT
jgi:hypothetical protein